MPVCAATGKMASSTDPSTWCAFEAAVAAVERLGASGIGFVFGPDRAYTGLDLDHVLHDGVLEEEYRWVVEQAGTYAEVSPSGDGLHLIFRGPKPEGAERCRRGPVEMYDHDRFFTVTGKVLRGCGAVSANPGVVERAYRTWIEPLAEKAQPTLADAVAVAGGANFNGYGKPGGSGAGGGRSGAGAGRRGAESGVAGSCGVDDLSDGELLERMRASRKGSEISALLDGDLSANGGDHSAADMALCSYLAFWCGGDEARMDRIFRSSGLMRPKWDSRRGGTTYGAQTIARAAANATEFYSPARRGGADGGRGCGVSAEAACGENGCSIAAPRGSAIGIDAAAGGGTVELDRAPSVEGWFVDSEGRLWTRGADGEPRVSVTSTAPWVACDLVDVDSGDVRALVRMRVAGKVVERAFDREAILSQNKIVGALSSLGANISSANAKEVVRYLTDSERRLGHARPRSRSAQHMGWADGPLGAFMPYDAGGEVRFDPAPDGLVKAQPFLEPAGTLEEWVAGMAPARAGSMAFRCVLAASFASPLVSLLGVQTFIVYLWGRSRSGKTPTLKAAGSVWGDPTEGAEGYFRTFADTPKSIVRAATLLHDVPIIIDELQSKGASSGGQAGKRMAVEDLLYSLSIGHERGALNSDRSMMRAGSWRSLTIATGEIPVVGDSTQQGAANRTLELNAEPFGDVRAAQQMHRLVAAQHGTAGRAFVDALRRNPAGFYSEQFATVRGAVGDAAFGHPQADNAALIAFADALAEFYVFSPGKGWEECLAGGVELARWCMGNATGREGGDTDLKAMQFVSEWLARNRIHFEDGCEDERLERYGARDVRRGGAGTVWCVFSSVLDRALSSAGYDRQKTLRRMADEGVLEVPAATRGYACQRRFRGGSRVYCVCIDNEALEGVLERAFGPAVLPGGGASPC